eukprot:764738-Hanusia_phi.AAC.4
MAKMLVVLFTLVSLSMVTSFQSIGHHCNPKGKNALAMCYKSWQHMHGMLGARMSRKSGEGHDSASTEASFGKLLLSAYTSVCMIVRISTFKLACLYSRVVMELVDIVLRVLIAVRKCCSPWGQSKKARRNVCIIGGSFGGLSCARNLMDEFNVTIIDQRAFFEYTPGSPQGEEAEMLRSCLLLIFPQGVNFCHGTAVGVDEGSVEVTTHGVEQTQRVKFDFLILACGSNYSEGIKPSSRELEMEQREQGWRARAEEVTGASSILVVGGGPVGVELAAEIVEKFPSKRVTLVDAHQSFCQTFASPSTKVFIHHWLTSRNVRVLLGHRCIPQGCEDGVRSFAVGNETVRR